MVKYQITPADPLGHYFEVTCTVADPAPEGQRFTLPAWIPGSYVIRDFAKHLGDVEARSDAGHVAVAKLDKQTWRCAPCEGPLTIRYRVYARDTSVRGAYLDDRRGLFTGPAVFVRAIGHEARSCRLDVRPPAGTVGADWWVETSLAADDTDARGFGLYRVVDYWDLIDFPVGMGRFETVAFEVQGVAHRFALFGEMPRLDRERLAEDLSAICHAHAAMFGALPVERYLFLAVPAVQGFGGIEHRESCTLLVERDALPLAHEDQPGGRYADFLGLCSHEYFHLWNVKRIRPQGVAGSDLSSEAHFRDLWAYEGVTSYYDELGVLRAGRQTPQRYLERLASAATRLTRNPGRARQSLAESSFDAWTKFYQPNENTPNAVVSYYNKGAFVALCLDLKVRLDTDGVHDLDGVMRALWSRNGEPNEPVAEGALETVAAEVTGCELGEFFERYVRGTEDPPFDTLLRELGIRCRRTAELESGQAALARWGVRVSDDSGAVRVTHVLADTPAQRSGLCPDDLVIAVDGLQVSAGNTDRRIQRLPDEVAVPVHVFRNEELLELSIEARPPPADAWRLELDPDADARAVARRRAWLGEHA